MRVYRVDEWLARLVHPELEVVEQAEIGAGDVLLTCAGFEERSTEALRRSVVAGCRGFRVLCIEYLPTLVVNQNAEVGSLCAQAGASLEWVAFDREDPAGAAERILARVPSGCYLHCDLSGMSRILIVQLVAALVRGGHVARSEVLYCSAALYRPRADEVDLRLAEEGDVLGLTMFVSGGVFGLTIVPELSSVAMQGQPMRVIVFPSWNTRQLAAVCSEMQAAYFTVVHGNPPSDENKWRPAAIRELNRVESLPARDELCVSTLDYRETLELLLKVYGVHGQREKLVVVPTGSKMQSLAVGLACGFLRDVQVVYPTPRVFAAPEDYTQGVGCLYRLALGCIEPK